MKQSFCIITCVIGLYTSLTSAFDSSVQKIISRYTRPVTLLEITTQKTPYSLNIADYSTVTAVALVLSAPHASHYLYNVKLPHNCVILNPPKLTVNELQTLGRCEHFDIVIVRDAFSSTLPLIPTTIESLTHLGDHLFIETSTPLPDEIVTQAPTAFSSTPHKTVYYWHLPKKSLDIPRWIARHHEPSLKPRYLIESTFDEKMLIKKGQRTPWIPGINLVTFFMLHGIYPTHDCIKDTLLTFKTIDHNDLILGNIIIQGINLVPIDFNDRRKTTPKKCIQTACMFLKQLQQGMDPGEAFKLYERRLLQLFPKKH